MGSKSISITVAVGVVLGAGLFSVLHTPVNPGNGPAIEQQAKIIQGAQAREQSQSFVLPVFQATYVPIRDFDVADPQIDARAVILLDARSGRVLFEKNSRARLPIASLTKLMSAMVILEHLDMSAIYTVAPEDLNLDGNGPNFVAGEQFVGADLFQLMLMNSSNDAVSVFSTAMHQQSLDIVGLMNQKAFAMGMRDTNFADPEGLNDLETYSTAFDIATLIHHARGISPIATALVAQRRDIETVGDGAAGTVRKVYHAINTNQLLPVIQNIRIGKTGNTSGALGTMAMEVGISGQENALIAVVLGSTDRFSAMKKLVQFGLTAHTWTYR